MKAAGAQEMAAAPQCRGDQSCKCANTRNELRDHPKYGVGARIADAKKGATATPNPYPRDIDSGWIVHKDTKQDAWVCSDCGHRISEHPETAPSLAPQPDADAWHVKMTLRGWRVKFGLRHAVTKSARMLGGYGEVKPNNNDIDVDVWFTAAKDAMGFIEECSRVEILHAVHWEEPVPLREKMPPLLDLVPQYQHVEGSPDRNSTVTDSQMFQRKASEAYQYQRIFKRPLNATQCCHIIPEAVLKKNISGAWMTVAADDFFNRLTDCSSPLDLTAHEVDGPKMDGRTPVRFTIHTREMRDEDRAYLLASLIDGFQRDDKMQTVSVIIHVLDPEKFVQATEWRHNCIQRIRQQEMRVSNKGANAWFRLEPLNAYSLLGEFERLHLDSPCQPCLSSNEDEDT